MRNKHCQLTEKIPKYTLVTKSQNHQKSSLHVFLHVKYISLIYTVCLANILDVKICQNMHSNKHAQIFTIFVLRKLFHYHTPGGNIVVSIHQVASGVL